MSDEAKRAAAPGQAPPERVVDHSRLTESYANYFRVVTTPDELILDVGVAMPAEPVKVANRVYLNFTNAKLLLAHLSRAIQHHESHFGPIEIDPAKRLRPQGGPPA